MIHNDSLDKQNRVINELNSSDYVFLIRTEQIDSSEWVDKEISLARKINIPILEFEFEELVAELEDFSDCRWNEYIKKNYEYFGQEVPE
mgnify:CR=1 FL=1